MSLPFEHNSLSNNLLQLKNDARSDNPEAYVNALAISTTMLSAQIPSSNQTIKTEVAQLRQQAITKLKGAITASTKAQTPLILLPKVDSLIALQDQFIAINHATNQHELIKLANFIELYNQATDLAPLSVLATTYKKDMANFGLMPKLISMLKHSALQRIKTILKLNPQDQADLAITDHQTIVILDQIEQLKQLAAHFNQLVADPKIAQSTRGIAILQDMHHEITQLAASLPAIIKENLALVTKIDLPTLATKIPAVSANILSDQLSALEAQQAYLSLAPTLEKKLDSAYEIYTTATQMLNAITAAQVNPETYTALTTLCTQARQVVATLLNVTTDEQITQIMQQRQHSKNYDPAYVPTKDTVISSNHLDVLTANTTPTAADTIKPRYHWYRLTKLATKLAQHDMLEVARRGKNMDAHCGIVYLSSQARNHHRAIIYQGEFLTLKSDTLEFDRCDTTNMITHNKTGNAAYVISARGELFIFNHYNRADLIAHSSFNYGAPVVAAGELKIRAGKLLEISTYSGHYQPKLEDIYRTLKYFAQQGIDLTDVKITGALNPRGAYSCKIIAESGIAKLAPQEIGFYFTNTDSANAQLRVRLGTQDCLIAPDSPIYQTINKITATLPSTTCPIDDIENKLLLRQLMQDPACRALTKPMILPDTEILSPTERPINATATILRQTNQSSGSLHLKANDIITWGDQQCPNKEALLRTALTSLGLELHAQLDELLQDLANHQPVDDAETILLAQIQQQLSALKTALTDKLFALKTMASIDLAYSARELSWLQHKHEHKLMEILRQGPAWLQQKAVNTTQDLSTQAVTDKPALGKHE